MTTPQDIQAAVDPSKEENWRYHDEYEFWYIEMPNTEIKTQRGDFTHGVGDRGFKPWELFQSHAPEASTVDVEALKKRMNNPTFDDDDEMPLEIEAYNHGWNDCIDELLRRGFRQEGGV